MRLAIVHETKYSYASPANYTIQYLRLSPQSTTQQKVLSWKLDVPGRARQFLDGYGNVAHVLVVEGPHKEVRLRARGVVEVADAPCAVPEQGPHLPDIYTRPTALTTADGATLSFCEQFKRQMEKDRQDGVEALMGAIRDKISYHPDALKPAATVADALTHGSGGSPELAHTFIACCRQLGVPARYVSGYLAPKSRPSGENGTRDTGVHAWAEVWVDGAGWVGLDVVNRLRAHGRHVRVAVGLDQLDAWPIRGFSRGGTGETVAVEVHVSEAPPREETPVQVPIRSSIRAEPRLRH
jgi:transglutaminase-like putative cysteine protease